LPEKEDDDTKLDQNSEKKIQRTIYLRRGRYVREERSIRAKCQDRGLLMPYQMIRIIRSK
jgi:hypothetical protein